ncbi:hypothetical protein VKT23_006484 [Stygiomarasmius scandens]|uniref:Uncharacterized protein n=1 Tax=Marasmiellus scandens TaxID=2682957 RepID=A0ABR1JMX9_9AGAR
MIVSGTSPPGPGSKSIGFKVPIIFIANAATNTSPTRKSWRSISKKNIGTVESAERSLRMKWVFISIAGSLSIIVTVQIVIDISKLLGILTTISTLRDINPTVEWLLMLTRLALRLLPGRGWDC